jgi:tetratricopeptide (TPR) repeat protein
MKPSLLFILTAGLCISGLHAQTDADPAAPSREIHDWEKGFLNLPEERRVEFTNHMNKSRELFGQKRVFECIEELGKAKAIYPDSPDVETLQGACQVEFRAFEKALEHFNRANELQPNAQSILFNIAEVYFVTEQWESAEEALSGLAEQAKTEENAQANNMLLRLIEFKLMLSKIKLGKMEEAQEMAELYDHLDDSPYSYYAEAAMAYEEGNELEAEMAMSRAARVFNNPAIISPWQDTMMEFGYMKSFFGGELPEEE